VWKNKPFDGSVSDLKLGPDGRWAAYYLCENRENSSDWERISLCCIRFDGRGARRLYTGGSSTQQEPELAGWSPDGKRLLYWEEVAHASSANADGSPLFDVEVRTGKRRLLTPSYTRKDGYRDAWMMQRPNTLAFSPNGKYLLLVRGSGRFMVENKRLARLEYATGKMRWLTDPYTAAILPAWSWDGRDIAYIANPDVRTIVDDVAKRVSRQHLWVIRADGQGRRQLTKDPHYSETEPRWLRGERYIQFIRRENKDIWNGRRSLWSIGADGSCLRWIRNLPLDPYVSQP
jgi:Tol biopolymer transport system component